MLSELTHDFGKISELIELIELKARAGWAV
jgi:hypothetical protein